MYGYLDRFGSFHYFGYVSNVQYPITNIFDVLLTLPFVPIGTMTNTFDDGFVGFCLPVVMFSLVLSLSLSFSLSFVGGGGGEWRGLSYETPVLFRLKNGHFSRCFGLSWA